MATRVLNARVGLTGERRFYTGMAVAVLASTLIGFAPSYYLRFAMAPRHPLEPLTPLVFAHGLIFSAWVVLFAAQTTLVAVGRVDLHRRLGMFGVGLALLLIPLAIAVGIGGIDRPLTAPPGVPPLSWAAIPLLDVPVFGGLIAAALYNRRRPPIHKRLMLTAMVDMMRPSLGRSLPILGIAGVAPLIVPLIFLLPLIAWDLTSRGRVHPATAWGSVAVVAGTIGAPLIWETPAWLWVARTLHGG